MAYVSQESICKTLITDASKAIKKGEFDTAEKCYQDALQRLQDAAGPVHPRIANVLIRLGDLYCTRQQYGEAEASFRRAIEIYEQSSGDQTMDIALCLKHLANVATKQGKTAEAAALKQQSRSILTARLGQFGMQTVPSEAPRPAARAK